jgi:hypothetical protein
MTISTTTIRNDYPGVDSTTPLPYTFKIFAASDLKVYKDGVLLTLTTDYTVSGVGSESFGNVTLTVAPSPAADIAILATIPLTQTTDLVNETGFFQDRIEQRFDKLCRADQLAAEELARALTLPEDEAGSSVTTTLPSLDDRKGKTLAFDATTGQPVTMATSSAAISAAMQPVVQAATLALARTAMGPWGDAMVTSTVSVGSATPTARSLANRSSDVFNVKDFGAKGDGDNDDSTAIQAAINAANVAGGILFFPPGTYIHSATLVWKNNVKYVGAGMRTTKITYTGVSDGNVINNPSNSSTAANITIQDISFLSTGGQFAGKADFVDNGSTYLRLVRCLFYGQMIGLILDQTEISTVEQCEFGTGAAAGSVGLWFINGADRTVGNTVGYTNQILVTGCQFNNYGPGISIVDDGGNDHSFISNNFNVGSIHARLSGVCGCVFSGGEYEFATISSIFVKATKLNGAAQWQKVQSLNIFGGVWYQGAANVLQMDAASIEKLALFGNTISTSGGVISGGNVPSDVVAHGNVQIGAGDGAALINNYFDGATYTPVWGSTGTAPAIGNGTLVGWYSRKGRTVSVKGVLTLGSTSTQGTGTWTVTTPVNADVSVAQAGGGSSLGIPGGVYYNLATLRNAGGTAMQFYPNASAAPVGVGVPAAWAAGNAIYFSFEFTAANNLG